MTDQEWVNQQVLKIAAIKDEIRRTQEAMAQFREAIIKDMNDAGVEEYESRDTGIKAVFQSRRVGYEFKPIYPIFKAKEIPYRRLLELLSINRKAIEAKGMKIKVINENNIGMFVSSYRKRKASIRLTLSNKVKAAI